MFEQPGIGIEVSHRVEKVTRDSLSLHGSYGRFYALISKFAVILDQAQLGHMCSIEARNRKHVRPDGLFGRFRKPLFGGLRVGFLTPRSSNALCRKISR
jgi:hypothetical protein